MKRPSIAASLAVLLLLPLRGFAQLPEFLTPVLGSEEAEARAINEYFLNKNTYFAKQYRIVIVNTSLLEDVETFKISLFDDVSVTVSVSKLRVHPEGRSILWTGRIIEPAISLEDLIDGGLSHEDAVSLIPNLDEVSIVAGEISFDDATGTKYYSHYPKFKKYKKSDTQRSANKTALLYDVGFVLSGFHLSSEYELHPLESDKQYHVLIEVDQEKHFTIGPLHDPNDPEQSRRRQAYQDFLDSIGPDPRSPDRYKE